LFQKLKQPQNLLPLVLLALLAALLYFSAQVDAELSAGRWLYEKKQGRFFPLTRLLQKTAVKVRNREKGFVNVKLHKPAVTLWTSKHAITVKHKFPAALFHSLKQGKMSRNASPFIKQKGKSQIVLQPWIYPVFLLLAALFLIQKAVLKTAVAVLLGALLLLYSLQVSGVVKNRSRVFTGYASPAIACG